MLCVQVTLNFTELPCQSNFSLAAAAVDEAGNIVESLALADATTPDVQWPIFVADTPELRATSHGSMWLDVALSEPGSVSVVVCSLIKVELRSVSYQLQ